MRASYCLTVFAGTLLLAACGGAPTKEPGGSAGVGAAANSPLRSQLSELQNDPELSSRAPEAIDEAEKAVKAAEASSSDSELGAHLAYIADRKLQTAKALAEARVAEDHVKALKEQRAQGEAVEQSKRDEETRLKTQVLMQNLAELHGLQSDTGLRFVFGDGFFADSNLRPTAGGDLDKLAEYLKAFPEFDVLVEGYTESNKHGEEGNLKFSQARADAVRSYLIRADVEPDRITAVGRGSDNPATDNPSPEAAVLNRRVEVSIGTQQQLVQAQKPTPVPDAMQVYHYGPATPVNKAPAVPLAMPTPPEEQPHSDQPYLMPPPPPGAPAAAPAPAPAPDALAPPAPAPGGN